MGPIHLRKKRRARPSRMKAKPHRDFKTKMATITLQTVLQSYRFASFIKSVPFEVVKGPTLEIKLFKSKWRTYLWHLSNGVLYAYGIFQAYSFPQVILSQGLKTESALHIGYIAMYSIGILYFGFMLRDPSTYVELTNGLDSLLTWTQEEDWTYDRWNKAPFAVITVNYFAQILATGLPIVTVLFVLTPQHSRYVFSVLPVILQDRWEILLLEMLLEGLIELWIASLLQVYYCYICMIVCQQLFWLDDLCRAAENCGLDVNKWRRIFSFYRSLKCLNVLHNEFFRHFAAGFNVILSAIAVLFLYCTLKALDLLPIWMYLVFPSFALFILVLILVLLPFMAKWEQKSADFVSMAMSKLRLLRLRDPEFEALFREVRAMQVVGSEIGHFGTTSLETSKEMILQIIDYLLLLLSL